jgi:Asp-tRNA(Asn)/Glu-tRNA(Gln) amidotransferase A subunit family amidase
MSLRQIHRAISSFVPVDHPSKRPPVYLPEMAGEESLLDPRMDFAGQESLSTSRPLCLCNCSVLRLIAFQSDWNKVFRVVTRSGVSVYSDDLGTSYYYAAMLFTPLLLPSFVVAAAGGGPAITFDGREATIESVHTALFSGLITCRDVVSGFLARIEKFNPTINSIISLDPDVLATADEMDVALANGNATGSLWCIPMLLKDNYDSVPLNTTAGCLALNSSVPTVDAPTVRALKRAGAVIMGKTNLHELALEGLSVSSLGGQTINPYDHSRTPGGSSGGTGAAIAASLAVIGTGTDTVNSLRSPASANSLFSFRPTRGLISRAAVVPISFTQDAVGAIGRSVADIARVLTVMASVGYDPDDNATALIPPFAVGIDYSTSICGSSLYGMRFGLIEGFFNRTATNETTPVNDAMTNVVNALTAAGATVVSINDAVYNATTISANFDVQQDEYREMLTAYLQRPSLSGIHPASMPALYASGEFLVIPSQYSYVKTALISSTGNATYTLKQYGIRNLTTTVEATFKQHFLDALIYPEQKNLVVKIGSPSQSGRNGILAALTGSPVITVPIGFSPATDTAPIGVPVGMEILGLPWSEVKLLGAAARIDDLIHARRMPTFANMSVEVTSAYTAVPSVTPDRGNIPSEYPVGML